MIDRPERVSNLPGQSQRPAYATRNKTTKKNNNNKEQQQKQTSKNKNLPGQSHRRACGFKNSVCRCFVCPGVMDTPTRL
jgi:hypothetical protein